jgi:hypothetical protein
MPGLMADNDVQGPFKALIRHIRSGDWKDVWLDLNLTVETFQSLTLTRSATDRVVWKTCQDRQIILVTGNRNKEGPDSLEATLEEENTPDSLPVVTLARPRRISRSKEYRERTAIKLLEYLQDLDFYRGVGRLYIP